MASPPVVRPRHLIPGDTVVVVTPSWAGPSEFPHVFEHGLAALRWWGLEVREGRSARAAPDTLARDPRARADDINEAFADPSVRAIVASIGGDDSIRLLPYLDARVIADNPKILMGYSDVTTILTAVRRIGIVTFHGPSVMAGLSQLGDLPQAAGMHLHDLLFTTGHEYLYPRFDRYVEGYTDWQDHANVGRVGQLQVDLGPRVLQGTGRVTGELFGGCLEVLDWLRGTSAWPVSDEWAGRLLFIETSEEKPTAEQVRRILRSFGVLGVFDQVVGLLVGRPRDHTIEERHALDEVIRSVVSEEFGRPDLPILAGLPFGHTDPQWVLPLGVQAELDIDAGSLRLIESWTT